MSSDSKPTFVTALDDVTGTLRGVGGDVTSIPKAVAGDITATLQSILHSITNTHPQGGDVSLPVATGTNQVVNLFAVPHPDDPAVPKDSNDTKPTLVAALDDVTGTLRGVGGDVTSIPKAVAGDITATLQSALHSITNTHPEGGDVSLPAATGD